jgi:hypothetical protein
LVFGQVNRTGMMPSLGLKKPAAQLKRGRGSKVPPTEQFSRSKVVKSWGIGAQFGSRAAYGSCEREGDDADRQEPHHDLGPKDDGTYVVEFKTSNGEALAEGPSGARKTTMIVALARKLLIALWRLVTTGEVPDGVELRTAA